MFFPSASYFDIDYTKENYNYYLCQLREINMWIKNYKARTFGFKRSSNEYKGRFNKLICF